MQKVMGLRLGMFKVSIMRTYNCGDIKMADVDQVKIVSKIACNLADFQWAWEGFWMNRYLSTLIPVSVKIPVATATPVGEKKRISKQNNEFLHY